MYRIIRYAVQELQKDVEKELQKLPESEREAAKTKFAVFVVHNKLKEKFGHLPPDVPYVVASSFPSSVSKLFVNGPTAITRLPRCPIFGKSSLCGRPRIC